MLADTLKMLDTARVLDVNGNKYTGAAVYDIAGYTLSKPTDSAVIMRFVVPRAMTIKQLFDGAVATSDVAPTGNAVYSIQRNGIDIGQISYAAGATVGSFTDLEGADHVFNAGDVLTIVAPVTADTTHDGLAFTLIAELN